MIAGVLYKEGEAVGGGILAKILEIYHKSSNNCDRVVSLNIHIHTEGRGKCRDQYIQINGQNKKREAYSK